MADALFDTTVFIDCYRGDRGAEALMNSVIGGSMTASYSAVTSFEIWSGISSLQEESDYLLFLAFCEEVALTGSMARQAAVMLQGQTARRSEALVRDALIAATAAERGELVHTRNVRDFRRFNVNVQSY
jgi:predicted nucleic acid-binding protein